VKGLYKGFKQKESKAVYYEVLTTKKGCNDTILPILASFFSWFKTTFKPDPANP